MIVDENGMCTLNEEDRSYHSNHKPRPLTNADRIRAMTDEELAKHLYWWDNSPLHASSERWLEWLKMETTQKDGGQEDG